MSTNLGNRYQAQDSVYRVLKLKDIGQELQLPSSKGYKTPEFLEMVIDKINRSGVRFVQFLQLVDVLYVVIDTDTKRVTLPPDKFRPEEEIQNHYAPKAASEAPPIQEPVEIEADSTEKFEEAIEAVKSRDHLTKNMSGAKLPWKK